MKKILKKILEVIGYILACVLFVVMWWGGLLLVALLWAGP